jgi:RNA-directed DNA polymerase
LVSYREKIWRTFFVEEMQMTATARSAGASSASKGNWQTVNLYAASQEVRKLQVRIAKAVKEQRFGKVKSLQWLLTHSYSAKVLAVNRVVTNKGKKTPGVDGIVWSSDKQKMAAVGALQRRGYRTQPLRRVYIPKSNGKLRPLSIPVMHCRAMQALYLLALELISECRADPNSYGFRRRRSTADAIEKCFIALSRGFSAQWILEGDIRSCFDKISHEWLEANIPMDQAILQKWLQAGYMEKRTLYRTEQGTPQGGIISPTLLNLTLSGLEAAIEKVATNKGRDRIHVAIYADDFIVTGASRELLENKVKPVIQAFLGARGLELAEDKTRLTHIDDGFDFLGQNVRKYGGKLLIKPSKANIKHFLASIRSTIKANKTTKQSDLIAMLNPKIRGWANYHRHIVAKRVFNYVDHQIFNALWKWAKRRHPCKSRDWVKSKYFPPSGTRSWVFSCPNSRGNSPQRLELMRAASTKITRHVKIRKDANPFDEAYDDYFAKRQSQRKPGRMKRP